MSTPRGRLRLIAIAEGTSYLLLLFVTMPLKYWADMPEPNYVVGMAHGLLFMLYVAAALHALVHYRWGFGRAIFLVAGALVPFVSFMLERVLRREEQA